MEKIIHLDKEIFEKVKSGKKKFEVRLGDEEINEGDELKVIQRDSKGNPTKNKIIKKVGHIENTKKLNYWSDDKVNKFGFKIIQLE
jgi:ASC-1-like (ASCH) protein